MLEARLQSVAVYRRAAALVGLIAVLAAVAASDALHETLLRALATTDAIIHRHALLGALAFVALAAISAMFAFVSIALVVPVAVFTWGPGATIGALWLGWILGGIVMYGLGVFVGRPVARWLAMEDALRRWESRLPADAPLSLIVLLQLALPSEITGYALGLLRYPFGRYVAALALAEMPYAIATVHLGASFVEGRSGLIVSTGLLLAMLSLAALHGLSRALSRERSESLPDGPAFRAGREEP
jgi:uncharacterized membrane protein YdjX (TVP38/TMEM64 family)